MNKKLAVGIDIGGSNTKVGIVDQDGQTICHSSFPTASETGFDDFILRSKDTIESLLAQVDVKQIIGVGIGAPNADSQKGILNQPPNLDWGTVPIKKRFAEICPYPIFLDNDANVAAIGEGLWGVASSYDNFVVVTLGTGVGTGVVVDGKVLNCGDGMAGEGGHLTIVPDGRPCNCGGKGHLECYASATGIKLSAEGIFKEELEVKDLGVLFHSGDEKALKLFDLTADYLAQGLAQIATILAPEAFILAGGVSAIGKPFDSMVERQLDQYIYPPLKGRTKILFSTISQEEGAVMGAAALLFAR